jgi:hypothetical protein
MKKEFEKKIKDNLSERIGEQEVRPHVEVWPEEDDFARWVASKRDKVRSVICNTPEYKDMPFCGRGYQ